MMWPEELPVGPIQIPLEESSLRHEEGLLGVYVHNAPYPVIQYDEDITDDNFRNIIIGHEVIEAWLRGCGAVYWLEDSQKEAICEGLAPFLVQLLEEYEGK